MKNSFYQLTDTETGRRYLKQMLDFIDKLRQSYKDDWEDLSDYLQGDMPPYNSISENIPGSSIKIPKLKEFTDNHVRAQWKAMGDTGFKKLNQATGHYTYHEYNRARS